MAAARCNREGNQIPDFLSQRIELGKGQSANIGREIDILQNTVMNGLRLLDQKKSFRFL
jgi:hypothetical protein